MGAENSLTQKASYETREGKQRAEGLAGHMEKMMDTPVGCFQVESWDMKGGSRGSGGSQENNEWIEENIVESGKVS